MGKTSTRYALYKEQRGKCHYCNVQMSMAMRKFAHDYTALMTACTIDHIIPRSKGGRNTRTNYVGACLRCNGLRGALPYEPFRWFVMRYGNKKTTEEIVRGLTEEEYKSQERMWIALGRYRPVQEEKPIFAPQWKSRRTVLKDVRTTLKSTVAKFNMFETNATWGKYLKQEKGSQMPLLEVQ